jgi:cytochrome c oxidase assembly protein subunit 19
MTSEPKGLPATPPEKGSFPIDHEGVCKDAALAFHRCLREASGVATACRTSVRAYLLCRMDHGLMTREDLARLRLGPDVKDERPEAATHDQLLQQLLHSKPPAESVGGLRPTGS